MENLSILERNQKESHREYAYRLLRYNIMQMILQPNQTINENILSDQLNISRTPIHEALLLLSHENLVTIVPQSGSRISPVSIKRINEGFFLRKTVEPPICMEIAGHVRSQYLIQLQELLQESQNLLETYDSDDHEDSLYIQRMLQLDDEFHRVTYLAANKPTIWQMVTNVCSHYYRIRYRGILDKTDDPFRVHRDHQTIFNYLMMGTESDSHFQEFYIQHLSHFRASFTKLYSEHPDFFIMD